ncbi:MAG: 30S ribosomal protein S4 [Candidatus Daviesbacteria bacterium]|nr:MAG: 30S ribosomal protein S4 [Candidatus Daviesbacteria bacterium]
MARFTGPKRKLSRREGIPLFPKDVKYMERKASATMTGKPSRRRRVSEYGIQLREKQKAKRLFGILEKQFSKYYKMASREKGSTGERLLEFLESRLDNVVYKLGFAASRNQARQYITHGHISVDGKKMTIPSYLVKAGQTIALSPKIVDNIQVKKALEESKTLPEWLERKATVGKVLRMPQREEMEQSISEPLIVEYYSR